MANDVTYQREDYQQALKTWRKAADVIAGADAVKRGGILYLPRTNPRDQTAEATARYDAYRMRATFVPIASRTLKSLIGAAFRKDPVLVNPSQIDYIADDVDGEGNSIYQQSQRAMSDIASKGRCFLLVDYPQAGEGVSVADLANVRATITRFDPESVINWRVSKIGAMSRLSLVVIMEQVEVDDGFGIDLEKRYRVLQLVDGVYTVTVYDETGDIYAEVVQPRDAAGRLWNEIPGMFIGAENNDTSIDPAPLEDIIGMNLDHYLKYADWCKSLHFTANPQPTVTGIDQEWRDYIEEKGMMIGSDAVLLLPQGADFKWAQINSSQAHVGELDRVRDYMVSLGARLLEKGGAAMTATQSRAENAAEYSVLALMAANVSEAYTRCLNWMARFMGGSETASYEISREYAESELDPAMLAAVVSAWQSGTVAKSDAREYMRRVGFIDSSRTDEDIEAEVAGETQGLALDANA